MFFALGCVDQDFTPLNKSKQDQLSGSSNISPMICEFNQQIETKFFSMTGSYVPPTLDYAEKVTINWQSNDMFYPDRFLGSYTLIIEVKNVSTHSVKYWKDGVGYGTFTAGSTKTYTWSNTCNGCTGPLCPESAGGSFYFTINSYTGNLSCDTDIQVKLYMTDGYNLPAIGSAQILTYHFVNQLCQ